MTSKKKSVLACAALVVLALSALGASSYKRISGGYINAWYMSGAVNAIYGFDKDATGEEFAYGGAADIYVPKWWSISNQSGAVCTLNIYTKAMPTRPAEFVFNALAQPEDSLVLVLDDGMVWSSEGTRIWGIKNRSQGAQTVHFMGWD
ncbi:MAG: hypothetical protein GY838_13590 [bacterium]|nr:hypothetical protein [bacterium]